VLLPLIPMGEAAILPPILANADTLESIGRIESTAADAVSALALVLALQVAEQKLT